MNVTEGSIEYLWLRVKAGNTKYKKNNGQLKKKTQKNSKKFNRKLDCNVLLSRVFSL